MWSYRLLSTRENTMVACFQFRAVRVYVHGSRKYLYFQRVFLSEILVSVRIPLYCCRLDTCRSYVSAERVKSNKRLTVCFHTSKSTHPTSVSLNNTVPFLPPRPLGEPVSSWAAQSCLPPQSIVYKENYCNLLRREKCRVFSFLSIKSALSVLLTHI